MKGRISGLSLLLAVTMGDASASLIGDEITGQILPGIGVVEQQFNSPATVGAGAEFTGRWDYAVFSMMWDVTVDVGASTFQVTVQEPTSANNNITDGPQMFGIFLGDLDWVNAPGQIIDVLQTSGPGGVASIAHGIDNITVFWDSFPGGLGNNPPDTLSWDFDIVAQHVPEPTTLALLALGLAGIGYELRRTKKAA